MSNILNFLCLDITSHPKKRNVSINTMCVEKEHKTKKSIVKDIEH